MNNEVFMKKLMEVPFIADVEMLQDEPNMNIGGVRISPVMLNSDGKWIVTPFWRNGAFDMLPHPNDVVNPDTGGMFRIKLIVDDHRVTFADDHAYELELNRYFKSVDIITEELSMSRIVVGSLISNIIGRMSPDPFNIRCGNNRVARVIYTNKITGSTFICKDPYDPTITEDDKVIFGKAVVNSKSLERYEKAYKDAKCSKNEYIDKLKKEAERLKKFAQDNDCAVVVTQQRQKPEKKDTSNVDFYMVTNVCPLGEYTPSVFKSFQEARDWMIKTAINNYIAGNTPRLGDLYKNFFTGVDDCYAKLVEVGGEGAVKVFIDSFLNDEPYNFISTSEARVTYSDETENSFKIYHVSVSSNGTPSIVTIESND